jgi:hypothetical protein
MRKKYSRSDFIKSLAFDPASPAIVSYSKRYETIYIVNDYLKNLFHETQALQEIWKVIGPAGMSCETHSLGQRLMQDCDDDALENFFYDNVEDYIDMLFFELDHKRCAIQFTFKTKCALSDVFRLTDVQFDAIDVIVDTGVSYEVI